jgi:galactokinase
MAEAEPVLASLPDEISIKVKANFINRDLTVRALELFASSNVNSMELGRLLTAHHEQLRDGLGVSTPKIERMMNASLAAGALGGKINGAGGGGCMFAYAPGHEEQVAEAIRREGGDPYIVRMDSGVRVDE